MKAQVFKSIIPFFLSTIFILFAIMSCNIIGEENPDCGIKHTHVDYITPQDVGLYSVLSDSIREYSYSFTLDDMCPHEHIKVDWEVLGADMTPYEGEFAADVYWIGSGIYEQQAQFTYDGAYHSAHQEIGFKQAFGDQPANAIFTFYVRFKTQGSIEDDDVHLILLFGHADVEVTFYYALSQ